MPKTRLVFPSTAERRESLTMQSPQKQPPSLQGRVTFLHVFCVRLMSCPAILSCNAATTILMRVNGDPARIPTLRYLYLPAFGKWFQKLVRWRC